MVDLVLALTSKAGVRFNCLFCSCKLRARSANEGKHGRIDTWFWQVGSVLLKNYGYLLSPDSEQLDELGLRPRQRALCGNVCLLSYLSFSASFFTTF